MSEIAIHIHDVLSFKGCRQSWHFSSMLREGLTPTTPARALFFGRAIHQALAVYYRSEERTVDEFIKPFDEYVDGEWTRLTQAGIWLTERDADRFAEDTTLGHGMLKHYASWAPDQDEDLEVLAVEVPIWFELPVRAEVPIYYEGTADALVRSRKDKRLWWMEHKTAKSFPDSNLLFMDEQHQAYLLGARAMSTLMDETIAGSIYTFLRKKVPTVPSLLKNGGLSKKATMDTTYEVYLATLEQYGLPTTLYGKMLNNLQAKGNTFFRRSYVERTEQSIEFFGRNLVSTIREMLDPRTVIYPSPTWFKCGRCAFRSPCLMVQHGLDPAPLLKQDYVRRKPKE